MRVLNQSEVSAVSGAATTPPTASPFIRVPLALFNGLFTVINLVISLPALLAYRG